MKKILPFFMIAAAASLWGIIAIFVRGLKEFGLTEMEIVTVRVAIAAIFLIIIGFVKFRNELKIKGRHIHYFFGTGILSIVFFNWCYFKTINQMNVSIAVILLYTSPAFVAVLSYLFLKEPLHSKKVLAVIGTIMGCILIAGIQSSGRETLTLIGILTGLGSGLGYALYTIFGKLALKIYQPYTVTLYTFLVATVILLPFSGIWSKMDLFTNVHFLIYSVGLGLIPTVLAYFIYTWGLQKTESSKAAVIATVEPIVATLLGLILYDEKLAIIQVLGSVIILISVILVNLPSGKREISNVIDV